MQYPLDLNTNKHGFVQFDIKRFVNTLTGGTVERPINTIRLYVPPGIVKTDGVTYANTDLKAASTFGKGATGSGEELTFTGATGVAGRLMARGLTRKALSVASNLIQDDILDDAAVLGALDLAAGIAINPNTKATLERINPRSFTMQFEFLPTSAEEAEAIHDITQVFREEMYPEFGVDNGGGQIRNFFRRRADQEDQATEVSDTGLFSEFFLKYPNTFGVSVHPAGLKTERQFVTRFKDSFLSQVSVSHAGAGTTYHKNGAPINTQMTLVFQESETPTKADIRGGF